MNRRELVNAIAAHTGHNSKDVDAILAGFTDVVTAVAAKGEAVVVSGFAKFVRRDSPARMGRNPATGEAIKFKASKKARITPLKGFKGYPLQLIPLGIFLDGQHVAQPVTQQRNSAFNRFGNLRNGLLKSEAECRHPMTQFGAQLRLILDEPSFHPV